MQLNNYTRMFSNKSSPSEYQLLIYMVRCQMKRTLLFIIQQTKDSQRQYCATRLLISACCVGGQHAGFYTPRAHAHIYQSEILSQYHNDLHSKHDRMPGDLVIKIFLNIITIYQGLFDQTTLRLTLTMYYYPNDYYASPCRHLFHHSTNYEEARYAHDLYDAVEELYLNCDYNNRYAIFS